MFLLKNAKKFFLLLALSSTAWADPVTVPPNEVGPPPVSCFVKTGADALPGGGMQIQFEILNWTDVAADGFEISLNTTTPGLTTGGLFGTSPDPLSGPFIGKVNSNDWSISSQTSTSVTWSGGTPLSFIDLDPNDDGNYIDAPTIPSPLDSGINALDGFLLNLPGLDVYERIVFDWVLTSGGTRITDDNGGFSFGTIQIDRAADGPNGEIRQSTFFSFGSTTSNITTVTPLDPALTDQNATTDPSVGANLVVPVPAAVWLFLSGLVSLLPFRLRKTDFVGDMKSC